MLLKLRILGTLLIWRASICTCLSMFHNIPRSGTGGVCTSLLSLPTSIGYGARLEQCFKSACFMAAVCELAALSTQISLHSCVVDRVV